MTSELQARIDAVTAYAQDNERKRLEGPTLGERLVLALVQLLVSAAWVSLVVAGVGFLCTDHH